MKVAVDEWPNEDAAEPERSGVYELDEATCRALAEYYEIGVVNSIVENGVKKIEDIWFLDYDRKDISQRNHMAGLYVIANGSFIGYDGDNIENRFSTTYTLSLTIEEIKSMLKSQTGS